MDARPALRQRPDGQLRELMVSARRSLRARMSDPYLTDHDRAVLQRFADFLSDVTLSPDPHLVSIRSEGSLYGDAESRTVGNM